MKELERISFSSPFSRPAFHIWPARPRHCSHCSLGRVCTCRPHRQRCSLGRRHSWKKRKKIQGQKSNISKFNSKYREMPKKGWPPLKLTSNNFVRFDCCSSGIYAYTDNNKKGQPAQLISHFSNYSRHPRPAHRGDQGGEREGGEPGGEWGESPASWNRTLPSIHHKAGKGTIFIILNSSKIIKMFWRRHST